MSFLEFLVKRKALKKDEANKVEKELKKTGLAVEALLLRKKLLEEKKLFQLKSEFLNIPLKDVKPEDISPDVFSIIPKESVEFYKMVSLGLNKSKRILEVGMVYPEDAQAKEALKFLSRQQKFSLKIYLITFSDFKEYLKKYRAPEKEVEKALERLEQEIKSEEQGAKKAVAPEKFTRLVEEAPVIKMAAVILRQAVEGRASDIHIEPTTEDLRVRYRLDGVLYTTLILPLKVHPAVIARVKILSRLKIDETRLPQDGRFSTSIGGRRVDFRVSTFPTTLGEKAVIRVLDPSESLDNLSDLGLQYRNLEVTERKVKKPYGMILVTGPTGSGKTTTLYTILKLLNKESVNIVTLEDPVEYFIGGVSQSQVRPEIEYTFAKGLRQILRQDPDIIMVGEIRDEETASLAIHAALTGHLMLSTLHTTSAAGVIPRLLDMGVKPFLLSPTLAVAVSQRLVRVLCPICKKRVKLQGATRKFILEKINNLPQDIKKQVVLQDIFEPKGCKKCNFTGYSGRKGIFEILEMTDNLAEIIITSPSEKAITEEAKAQGMMTMEEDGILRVLEGSTSLEEVMRVAES